MHEHMDFRKCTPFIDARSVNTKPLKFSIKGHEKAQCEQHATLIDPDVAADIQIDIREIYFLIMHFLSSGPCQRTCRQFWNELLEHQLLPRRYHAWYSRSGVLSGHENDNGDSFPLSYGTLVERYPHIEKDHLLKLLKQLMLKAGPALDGRSAPNAVDVPTLLGTGSFSLLASDRNEVNKQVKPLPEHFRWPHMQAGQVRGLTMREIGGGFTKHHRAPSIHFACYTVAKPLTMVQKMQNIKKLRGHRDAVYCAIFDRSGRYVITGSDDRLVKIWSMETAFCLASCRGHEGDITDLAVSSNNVLVASASNDYSIRVWRLPDGLPISVLRGHIGAVTAIAFSPRHNAVYQLLSSSDDGSCRIWDARCSLRSLRVYHPKPTIPTEGVSSLGKSHGPSSNNAPSFINGPQSHQILCCTYNADGTVFVTGSSDTFARVWSAGKSTANDSDQPYHEIDALAGHENDVNYVQFCGCAVAPRSSAPDSFIEDNKQKFRNSRFNHDNIVTCSRDGSAIIWVPKSRKSHGRSLRWKRAYHLKVPPPPMPPQPPRGGPRQRLLPTPRGVNMIVWSLDNRFVLAAIMDCRICVWNATDGSLVHSLTGHSQSTYVLDVHPFNPRIAMSAGYDGKTIVWDIWEGTPIWTYEIGRFKLVDGKFSPDGTSIVLSDDAGQIYLLNTGQGDSQKDAKYDQFFLGDYRPLVQDSFGNVVDQETQLAPHRRNIQDPLCDSSMIPYAEPYQSMYQRHRLGALGIEWRPASIKFTIGTDIGLGHEMLPLPDLDGVIEPPSEFIDALLYWEPENEVINDDTDSEYNATDEYCSEGDRGILYSSASSDPECSEEEDNISDQCHKDGLRRSKRRKHKAAKVKLITSLERRGGVKRRNLDQHDGTSSRTKIVKKQKSGRKTCKKIKANALRSQRVAARNATSLFFQITEASADGSSEDDSSESEITQQDLKTRSNEAACNFQNVQLKDPKDEHASLYDSRNVVKPPEPLESQMGIGKRTRLVLKLPYRDIKNKTSENTRHQFESRANLASSPYSPARGISKEDQANFNMIFKDPGPSSANAYGANELSEDYNRNDFIGREPKKVEGQLEISTGGSEIKRGVVNVVQSPNQMKPDFLPTDESTGFCASLDENDVTVNDKPQNEFGFSRPTSLIRCKFLGIAHSDEEGFETGASERMDDPRNKHLSTGDAHKPSLSDIRRSHDMVSVINHSDVSKDSPSSPKLIKLRIKSNKISRDPQISSQLNDCTRQIDDAGQSGVKLKWSGSNPEGYSGALGERDSKGTDHNDSSGSDLPEDYITDAFRRTRSMGLHATFRGDTDTVSRRFEVRRGLRSSGGTSKDKSSKKVFDQVPSEEWTRNKKITSRNKGGGYCDDDEISSAPRSQPSVRTSNWLTQSQQEEACRYIPQLGDDVVYLVQGHQEYSGPIGLSEKHPSSSIEKKTRAVEFCSVKGLSYSQVPGSGDSCCRITLKFTDPSSSVFGEALKFPLPELTNFPDFVVERTRYDAAIRRNWSVGDKCQVWWRSESDQEGGGSWWKGQIVGYRDKSLEFLGSPWERFQIQYDGDSSTTEPYHHSPWELYDPESSWEHPHIVEETEHKLLFSFQHLQQSVRRKQDPYGILKLNQVAVKPDFINKFPVPLSPDLIELRLKNKYYRTLEAVKHDLRVMMSNAQTYFEKNAEVAEKMKLLSERFTKTLSKL